MTNWRTALLALFAALPAGATEPLFTPRLAAIYRTSSGWVAQLGSTMPADGAVFITVDADDRPRAFRFTEAGEWLRRDRPDDDDCCFFSSPQSGWLMEFERWPPDSWPEEATLVAAVDALGPGRRSAWLRAGFRDGVTAGDRFLKRLNGQPVARFDVLTVADELCFARVTPLASDAPLAAGELATLWPSPAERLLGRRRSAVCAIERQVGDEVVWIAAPDAGDGAAEPAVTIHRAGRYIASGVVEAPGPLFWKVRLLGATSRAVQVGDDAVIRTPEDIAAGRVRPRVFEVAPGHLLIDAGEADGVALGQSFEILHAGASIGRASVTRVQRGYSVLNTAELRSAPAVADEARLGAGETDPPARLNPIVAVWDDLLFQLSEAPPQANGPIAVLRNGQVIGAAVVAPLADRWIGLALPGSQQQPFQPGDVCRGGAP